ncbi:zinc-dependent metalloprotease [Tomitella biformata]|uniref:zinc-dependent metalloprotease n=1 Tax=Tomitella biformata TaxID=630403 RepID=UPI000467D1E4|nr:zinc-dependent metalloprotease [Tomitella biformata]
MSLEEPGAGPQNANLGADIDWAVAAKVGARLAPAGPKTTAYTLEKANVELLAAAVLAEGPVREVTGLADGLPVPAAQVVDRPGWIGAATQSMRSMLSPPKAEADTDTDTGTGTERPGLVRRVGGQASGAQAGAVLAFLSTAILGQYDPFTGEHGTLLLVTPNIIAVERALRVRPGDFRLWVCLHEVTHRVQFSSAPWLADYMKESVDLLGEEVDEPMSAIAGRLSAEVRRRRAGDGAPESAGILGLLTATQAAPQREAIERLLMLGTLLEGHADHVMDSVGPKVVPTVASIRRAFDGRRQRNPNPVQRIMRALLGVDAKMAQYVRGKAFVDEVVGTVGMTEFNAIWTGPETLPRSAEIEQPRLWIDRVLG